MHKRFIIGAIAVASLAGGASAQAATVSVTEQTLRFTAQSGEHNVVAIGRDFSSVGTVTVTDTGARLVAGEACTAADAHTVTCEAPVEAAAIVALGDRDDQLTALLAGGDVTVRAGTGNDRIGGVTALYFGGTATLHGDDGNDRIDGAASMENRVYGDAGADQLAHRGRSGGLLDGGAGDDHLLHHSLFIGTLRGGAGDDVLEHDDPALDVPSMDGGADDDELRLALPGGVVGYAPSVRGGSGTDRVRLTGLPSAVAIADRAEAGFDLTIGADVERLYGTAGADRLLSDGTGHVLFGGEGDDRIDGGGGDDQLFGEGGDDELVGGSGRDAFDGGAGSDAIDARDGERDSIACGAGADSLLSDPVDRLRSGDCETPTRFKHR